MNTKRVVSVAGAVILMSGIFLGLTFLSRAQTQDTSSSAILPDSLPDSVVRIAAEAQGLSLASPDQIPPDRCGTFWIVTGEFLAPWPFLPAKYDLASTPVFLLGPNEDFLVDGTGGIAPQPTGDEAVLGMTAVSLLQEQGTMVLDFIAQVQAAQAKAALAQGQRQVMAMDDSGPPSPGDGDGSGGTNGYFGSSYSIADYGTNLWVRMDAVVSNNLTGILSNTLADVPFELQTNTDLASTNWVSAGFVYGSELTNWTAWSLPMSSPSNLFVRIRSWADDGSGLPIWWQLQYFGHTGVDPNADPMGDGWSNIQKFQNGMNPNLFYTPPAPQGLTASYNANNSTAFVSWLPSSGQVTGYTVQKHDSWTGLTTNYYFGTNISSFVDNVSSDVPYPFQGDTLLVSYQIQAHYGTNGDSYWGGPASLQQSTISASIIAGPQGSAYLATSALPPGTVALRVTRIDEFASSYFRDFSYNTNFDIPVTNLTNGFYLIPPTWAITMPDSYGVNSYDWSVKTVNTNGNLSAAALCSFGGSYTTGADTNGYVWLAAPYFDMRQQTKDNLRFLLRAATETPFTFQVVSSQFSPYVVTWPTNYVYADADALGSIWDNYFYRNFVFDQSNLTTDGNLATGCYDGSFYDYYDRNGYLIYEGNLYITNQPLYDFNADAFLAVSNPVVPSSLLTATQSRWIRPQLSGDFVVAVAGGNNVYGLTNLSVEDAAVVNGNLTLATYYPGDNVPAGGYRYLESAQPDFQTVEYDFWNSSPLPGNSGFAVTNKSDLLITSVGLPLSLSGQIYSTPEFQVSGYAKLAVMNGGAGIYGYLGQYFDEAYQIDNNGNVTTNTTGVLSPYGQFFATEPGPAALVTMPDIDTGQRGTCTVYCVSLALDKNHDGTVDLSWNGPDATFPNSPFVFWANNNYDRWLYDSDDATNYEDGLNSIEVATLSSDQQVPDCHYGEYYGTRIIPTARDLEDFARLWVCGITTNLLSALPANSTVTLSWGDVGSPNPANPTIDLFAAADPDGGIGYLTNSTIAANQINPSLSPFIQRLAPGGSIQLNANYFGSIWRGNYFIWCGVTNGTGGLTLTIADGNGNVLATASQWIQIVDIKQMYERWTVGDNPNVAPTNVAIIATDNLPTNPPVPAFLYPPPQDTNTPYILFVHGWNMRTDDKDHFAETAFKRLYWQGYQGRFGLFRWPTDYGFNGISSLATNPGEKDNFDRSEYNAWRSGTGLLNLLNRLNGEYPDHVYMFAHSMGNVVAGEALRLEETNQVVNTYIASQAAVSAHTYDQTLASYSFYYPPFSLRPATPNIYGDWFTLNIGSAGRIINFYNVNDYALQHSVWQLDQLLKPDQFVPEYGALWDYGYNGSTNDPPPWNHFFKENIGTYAFTNLDIVNILDNRYEVMAFAAQSYTTALGATPYVGNLTAGLNLTAVWPSPDPLGNNYASHFFHSAEFRGNCVWEWGYWNMFLHSSIFGFNISSP